MGSRNKNRNRNRKKCAHKSQLNLNNTSAVPNVNKRYVPRPAHRAHRRHAFNFVGHILDATFHGLWHFSVMCMLIGLGIMLFFVPYGVIFLPEDRPNQYRLPLRDRPEFQWALFAHDDAWDDQALPISKHVAVFYMNSIKCKTTYGCKNILSEMERVTDLSYNFLIFPNGYVYHRLGWNKKSSIHFHEPTLVFTFIGQGRKSTQKQYDQLYNMIRTAVDEGYLESSFIIYPTTLNRRMKKKTEELIALTNAKKTTEILEINESTALQEIDESTIQPEIDGSTIQPEIDKSSIQTEIDKSSGSPEIDESTIQTEIDESTRRVEIDESTIQPEIDDSND